LRTTYTSSGTRSGGHLEGDRNTAARQRDHDDLGIVTVMLEETGENLSGFATVPKRCGTHAGQLPD
jgi:hypothetical protein